MRMTPVFALLLGMFILAGRFACASEPGSKGRGRIWSLEQLAANLQGNPGADADGDGILTEEEWKAFLVQKTLDELPQGTTHRSAIVSMRDGVKLPVELLLPPGDAPRPAVVVRGAYGRFRAIAHDVLWFKNAEVVFVLQTLRGDEDAEGAGTFNPFSFDNEILDSYDTIEWVARQKWCNGRVGIDGGSGNGFCGYMAMLANPPHLFAAGPKFSGGNTYLYWSFHNGVRRRLYNWLRNRNTPVTEWPKPTVELFDLAGYEDLVRERAAANDAYFITDTGWYDIFSEAALDYFAAFAHTGKVFVQVNATGHGPIGGLDYPKRRLPSGIHFPKFIEALTTDAENMPSESLLVYYLMGDTMDPNAPGNVYKTSHVWPIPHNPISFFMRKDGSLELTPPRETEVAVAYEYDPRNPVPTIGGAHLLSMDRTNKGPIDQRPLRDRADILRFVTEPLEEPLEVTGKVRAELFVSTDVPDTTFMVKLVDVYPSGYEALVLDSAAMARYWQGLDKPAPLEKGKVYRLELDLWSTALVFNKGHRIAVHVTSSNSPKYEVHPNTYEPVDSFDGVPTAHNNLHVSAEHPSRLILPVVQP